MQTLIQLGQDITSDSDTVRALLLRFGISESNPPRDVQVVEIMSTLARLAAEGTAMCDVGALVRALSSFVSASLFFKISTGGPESNIKHVKLDWANVIKTFDWPDRHGVDTATLKLLIAILLNCPRDAEPHAGPHGSLRLHGRLRARQGAHLPARIAARRESRRCLVERHGRIGYLRGQTSAGGETDGKKSRKENLAGALRYGYHRGTLRADDC